MKKIFLVFFMLLILSNVEISNHRVTAASNQVFSNFYDNVACDFRLNHDVMVLKDGNVIEMELGVFYYLNGYLETWNFTGITNYISENFEIYADDSADAYWEAEGSVIYYYDNFGHNTSYIGITEELDPLCDHTDNEAPTAPTNLRVTLNDQHTGYNLQWDESQDNDGVNGYQIYSGNTQIGTTGSTTYLLPSNSNYDVVQVYAVDYLGNISDPSEELHIGNLPPTPPTNIRATMNNNRINLSWDAPSVHNGVFQYLIYR
ncbi:MAG TPA: fibronectin type III domain-containing protein [Ureibacillus sp.]|nr:fibronectin type III domain-containing protein [Ureibacillus sp.]